MSTHDSTLTKLNDNFSGSNPPVHHNQGINTVQHRVCQIETLITIIRYCQFLFLKPFQPCFQSSVEVHRFFFRGIVPVVMDIVFLQL